MTINRIDSLTNLNFYSVYNPQYALYFKLSRALLAKLFAVIPKEKTFSLNEIRLIYKLSSLVV